MIDAHHHLWDPSRRDYPWMAGTALEPIRRPYTVDDLRAVTKAAGVKGTVLVQTVSSEEETREFLAAAQAEPLIVGVVGWTDLTAPDVAERVASFSGPLAGIRHQAEDEPDPSWLTRPEVLRGLAALGKAGLAYDLLVKPPQLPAALAAAKALPDQVFVLDHAAKPPIASGEWQPWADGVAALGELDNVYCKLSGLVTEADWARWKAGQLARWAEHVLESFGASRLMFGSDWPVCELAAAYEVVVDTAFSLTGSLSDAERLEFFDGTARRAYHLS
ncbi:L-fuconolactonase [Amycolatopsis lurida]|uniref:Amidohydrolase n=1 Tax=Amycolatopsis lurida NRRL 2430 TaxID=1460371 RepID=A0A2P2FIP9_AMYLU|nr:amidohydrolase family protein [Amycolatopsis lurida]KFU76600.1 amidohydrolase [Amycolatopsis lurida NRRL 2430]SEE37888.1 L-fuconolactonase [Amycolatopsis lurida]